MAVYTICCCWPAQRRKLSLWRCGSYAWCFCSNSWRSSFGDSYERCICVYAWAYFVGTPTWTQQPGRFESTSPFNLLITRAAQQLYNSKKSSGTTPANITWNSYLYEAYERLCSPFSAWDTPVSCQQHPEGGHPRPKHKQDVAVKSPNNPSFFPIPQHKPNLDMRWPEQIFLTPMTKHSKLGMIIGLPTLLAHRPYSGLGSTFERTSKRTRCRYNGGLYFMKYYVMKERRRFLNLKRNCVYETQLKIGNRFKNYWTLARRLAYILGILVRNSKGCNLSAYQVLIHGGFRCVCRPSNREVRLTRGFEPWTS